MKTLKFFAWLVIVSGLVFSTTLARAEAGSRPNVILVMTDDQGYGDIRAHGNSMIHTPNLDRLHSQSVRLTNFHVDPTCSPTRSALMTGRYSSRTGVWHTIMGRSLMRTEEVTLAEVFRDGGYETGIFGKWHLGDNYPLRPQDQGFSESIVHGGGGVQQTPDYWGNDYFDDTYWHNGRPRQFAGYCTDVFFEGALNFIRRSKERNKPFFCYITTNAPHGPYLVDEKYSRPYADRGVPDPMSKFYGMIENIDENLGKLVKRLEEWGLDQNTILIFMTDNGTAAGLPRSRQGTQQSGWQGFNDGMHGKKGSEYEGGHRVPFFIRWPAGKIGGGRDVDKLAAHIDILPTLVDLCGLQRPKGAKLDGTSLAPLLRGQATWPDRTLFVHSQRIEHPEKWRKSAVITQRWRLINGKELYDIQLDPGQSSDVAQSNSDVVMMLRAAYERWWDSISSRFDEYVGIAVGSVKENPVRITCHDWHPVGNKSVPWNQPAVRRAPEGANGFWVIDVLRDGRYEFIVRQQPTEARFRIQATQARLKIGNQEQEQSIPAGATGVPFVMNLKAGQTRMQSWFTNDEGKSRGAFFIYAKLLP